MMKNNKNCTETTNKQGISVVVFKEKFLVNAHT